MANCVICGKETVLKCRLCDSILRKDTPLCDSEECVQKHNDSLRTTYNEEKPNDLQSRKLRS